MFVSSSTYLKPAGYQISRSVRLRPASTPNFSRTPGTATNRQTFTYSGWVKKAGMGTVQYIFGAGGTISSFLNFTAGDQLQAYDYNSGYLYQLVTTQLFRDPNAWYHIVYVSDTTQATASSRIRLYVNGVQVTSFSTATYPAQNYQNTSIDTTVIHYMGYANSALDGNLAEVNFVDGQALTPSSFGQTDSATGAWIPQKYAGTYGTNGFFLNFADNSASTAATIGKDTSGNGNNFTPTNISISAGSTYDSFIDAPLTVGGSERGNYCTLNSISPNSGNKITPTDGNMSLSLATGAAAYFGCPASFIMTSGKWYWECLMGVKDAAAGEWYQLGIIAATVAWPNGTNVGATTGGYCYVNDGLKASGGGGSSTGFTAYGATFTNGDVIGIAFDADNGTLSFYKNGVAQGTAFTAITNLASGFVPAFEIYRSTGTVQTMFPNFGQRPFSYVAPTGYYPLHTGSLVAPSIKKSNVYFDATTYSGTGVSRSVVNGGMQPDLLWIKNRNSATTYSNQLQDSARGVQKQIASNSSAAETALTTRVTSFDTSGFTVSTDPQVNGSGNAIVAWQFKKGSVPGFDVVLYTGTATNQNVSHSLGAVPKMIIVKGRSSVVDPMTYHASLGLNVYMFFDTTAASASVANYWGAALPTSSVFSLTNVGYNNNLNGTTYVGYLFAEIPGFSKISNYTGNGSTDGPFVNCGFRPRFLMTKRTDSTGNWWIQDTGRSLTNPANAVLFPNTAGAEYTTAGVEMDFLSSGFKLRHTNVDGNASGGSYIYMAFAENPFKYSLAR